MPSINWTEARKTPWITFKIVASAASRTIILVLTGRFISSRLSLRNSIARIWLGETFTNNASILYSEPANHDTQIIQTPGFKTYVYPATSPSELTKADAVIIYAHGGGMMIGHPLQYQQEYERWRKKAKSQGKNIVFLCLQYPLSPVKRWPAQRETMISSYEWLLSQSVQPSHVVFAGDSAGCDLNYLSLLYLRDHESRVPPPACVVSISPWLDWTGSETIGHPNWHSDFMFGFDAACTAFNNSWRPEGLPFETPEISAVLVEDVSRLPPQLVIYSRDEILASDSRRWVEKSQAAGVDTKEYAVNGEMHTFAVGWPITGSKMQETCDELILRYIFDHV